MSFLSLSGAVAGALTALASIFPGTVPGALFGIFGAFALVFCARRSASLQRQFFLFGLLFGAIAFYWLPSTMELFGGFPKPLSYLIFLLYLVTAALQFVICAWLYKKLSRTALAKFALALPAAWLVTEFLYPRLFPWYIAHSQIAITPFSSLAQFVGVPILSALFLWWIEAAYLVFSFLCWRKREDLQVAAIIAPSLLLLIVGAYGAHNTRSEMESAEHARVGLIQGNLEAKQKGDVRYFDANLGVYRALSQDAIEAGAELLLWPESVFNMWTPENVESVRGTDYDPFPDLRVPFLYGALGFRLPAGKQSFFSEDEVLRFNSAIGLSREGKVQGFYHKQVLMPLGEYIPFADIFPKLKELSPQTGDFNFGDLKDPIVLPVNGKDVALAPLICYEDLVPRLSREAVKRGAEVLVNLTNDAWYGDSAAPYQHNLLAAWRAIETKRSLLRVTNTGFTAVINPLGETESSLQIFTKSFLVINVPLLKSETLYTRTGDVPVYILTAAAIVLALFFSKKK